MELPGNWIYRISQRLIKLLYNPFIDFPAILHFEEARAYYYDLSPRLNLNRDDFEIFDRDRPKIKMGSCKLGF